MAELVPPRPERASLVSDALLAEAVRNGLITPPTVVDDAPPPRKPVVPLAKVLGELARDRDDR